MGNISLSLKADNGSKASIPNAKDTVMIEDEDSLLEWIESIGWDQLLAKLEKTDLPSEVIDIIEELSEAVEDGKIDDFIDDYFNIGTPTFSDEELEYYY